MPTGLGVAHPVDPLPLLPALVAADVADQQVELRDPALDRNERLGFHARGLELALGHRRRLGVVGDPDAGQDL